MYPRLCNPLKSKSFFLLGARGTGKTQLLRSVFGSTKGLLWIDLLQEGELLSFVRRPAELRARVESLGPRLEWVVIDGVQRAPQLLNEVHALIEERGIK